MPAASHVNKRRVVIGVLIALLCVSFVQVAWWMYDQQRHAALVEMQWQKLAASDDPAAPAKGLENLRAMHADRRTQYAWEGTFFLLVLTAAIAVIWRGLRAEHHARRRQETFLALVSHQFKTPLASLRLAVETITLRHTSAADTERLAGRALDDVQRLEDLVTNILESARLDEGRVELRRERLPLARLVTQTAERLNERARRLGVELSVDVAPDLHVLADPIAADAVLRNLIENAVASVGPRGGGTVAVTARPEGAHVAAEVRDSGVGFDQKDAPALFEKFGLAERAWRTGERTGLGLYIVKRLMELGGGSVRARSDGPGRGATFTVLWPKAAEE
jgi:two-component system, OmpR family, phosphate regulon sensor histidine kinase PhoR